MLPNSGRLCCVLATRDPQSHQLLSSASDASVKPRSLGPVATATNLQDSTRGSPQPTQ